MTLLHKSLSDNFHIFAKVIQDIIVAKEMLLPNRLKEIRLQSNMPQRKFAAELDINTATYCKYENGVMHMYIAQLEKVIKYLNANHDEHLTLLQADQFCNTVSTNVKIAKEAMEIVINQYQIQK